MYIFTTPNEDVAALMKRSCRCIPHSVIRVTIVTISVLRRSPMLVCLRVLRAETSTNSHTCTAILIHHSNSMSMSDFVLTPSFRFTTSEAEQCTGRSPRIRSPVARQTLLM